MKMQAGSGGLHCGVEGRQTPFAQNSFAAHLTLAQAVACAPVEGTWQVPFTQRPSPQSESTWQGLPFTIEQEASSAGSQGACCLSTQAASSAARARKQNAPLPIRHLPQRLWQGVNGGAARQAALQARPESAVTAVTCKCPVSDN